MIRRIFLSLLLLPCFVPLHAQDVLHLSTACGFYGKFPAQDVYAFMPGKEIEGYVAKIVGDAAGTFQIRAGNVSQVVAALQGNARVLLYDQYSFAVLETAGRNKWISLGILAHQIGHHMAGDTLPEEREQRRRNELEADRYAGAALRRLGASLEDARLAWTAGSGPAAAGGYPPLSDRVAALTEGWQNRGEGQFLSAFAQDVPRFDWPPPVPSARDQVPSEFVTGSLPSPRLIDAAERLEKALREAGYRDISYYAVPEGFALVSQLEQINEDGSPKEGDERWAVTAGSPRVFSLGSYLETLFKGKRGFFRVVVLVVTSAPFRHGDTPVDFSVAKDWLWNGNTSLPPSIGIRKYTSSYSCVALIYEFASRNASGRAVLVDPSNIAGRSHLTKAGIWRSLSN